MSLRENKTDFDVIIIGGGAAGLAAALWCDDLKLNALLLESGAELGGQLLRVYNPIKNYLGRDARNGRDLRDRFLKQIGNHKFIIRLESEIGSVDLEKKEIKLETGERFSAQFLIAATGVRRRKLNVEGEDDFKGRGVIESGKRNAKSVKNKRVCIIGGGDAAFENALILAETASSVTLVHRGKSFRARAEFVGQVKSHPKIKILAETSVRKIFGSKQVEAIDFENLQTKGKFRIDTDAILIRIGVEPNTEFLRGKIELDENGYVKINMNCETNIKNVFAIGDVANPLAPTISSAVGMGATAVKTITNYELRIEEICFPIRNS
ncbi:MAG: NAD(P)/FAD-dependent oxidoreductase [Pyrinomonadaceae bacterium]